MAVPGHRRLSGADRFTIAMVAVFMVSAFTTELYFLVHHDDIRQRTDLLAQVHEFYGKGDESYYGRGYVPLPLAFTAINIFITQPLNALLILAIVRRRKYRHPLQLAVSAYMSSLVILYLLVAHISDHQGVSDKTWSGYFIIYAMQLPWLAGYVFLVCWSFVAIVRVFKNSGLGAGAPVADEGDREPLSPRTEAG